MHVLGLPPAFVLSQDQTLRLRILILDFLPGANRSRWSLCGFRSHVTHDECRRTPSVMENAIAPESRRPRPEGFGPPGLRRLRFPFFNQQCQRATHGHHWLPRMTTWGLITDTKPSLEKNPEVGSRSDPMILPEGCRRQIKFAAATKIMSIEAATDCQ